MCFSQTYTFKVSKDMYESIKVDANKESETFSRVMRRLAKRKEIVSTTLTRSVTNIKDQTSQTHLNLESFFVLTKNWTRFFMRFKYLVSPTFWLKNLKLKKEKKI